MCWDLNLKPLHNRIGRSSCKPSRHQKRSEKYANHIPCAESILKQMSIITYFAPGHFEVAKIDLLLKIRFSTLPCFYVVCRQFCNSCHRLYGRLQLVLSVSRPLQFVDWCRFFSSPLGTGSSSRIRYLEMSPLYFGTNFLPHPSMGSHHLELVALLLLLRPVKIAGTAFPPTRKKERM